METAAEGRSGDTDRLKNEGNQAFLSKNYDVAVLKYSEVRPITIDLVSQC